MPKHKKSEVHIRLRQKLEARKDKRIADEAPNGLQRCLVTILLRINNETVLDDGYGFDFEEFKECICARIFVQLLDAICDNMLLKEQIIGIDPEFKNLLAAWRLLRIFRKLVPRSMTIRHT